jgi:uncharacterized protein (TIGR02996 family)
VSDHDALLCAIGANPADDLPRLVFADWLEEHDQPERAQFIRAEVDLYRRPEWDGERARYEHGARLEHNWPDRRPWLGECAEGPLSGVAWSGEPVVRRGFPWCVRVANLPTLSSFWDHFANRWPVERVDFETADLLRLVHSPVLGRLTALAFPGGALGAVSARAMPAFANDPRVGHLEALTFSGGSLSPAGVRALLESPLFANLAVLGVNDHATGVGLALLEGVEQYPPGPRFRTLELRTARLGEDGFRLLAAARALSGVTHLDLRENHVNAARAQLLAESPAFADLRVLVLAGNSLGNAGTVALALSSRLSELRVLDLSFCQVGDDGVRAILDSPLAEQLVLLNLSGSPASEETKQALKERMGDRVRV